MMQFKSYLFNTSLNNLSVAIYEGDSIYELVVEKDGEEYFYMAGDVKMVKYQREVITKRFLGERSVSEHMAEKFLTNEDDIYYNESQALSDVLDGLNRAGHELSAFGESGE